MIPRAVLYARCSTEEESQRDALVKQTAEGEECIRNHGWIQTDSYVESRSGTSTKNRTEYNRLYDDLDKDKFEIIVIKSQDRLMRNTKDWYLFVDRLSKNGKKLYIYLEAKFYTPDDALLTGIKAILAEEYSRELSKKINNAHRSRQKSGRSVILTSNTYGYRKLPDKTIEIIEEEAEVKRRMYELCASGCGGRTIALILKKEGVLNRNGNPFSESNIRRMIKNPLNKGTVVMGKKHYDFDSKRMVSVPEEYQYVHENRVPAIVTKELWEAANREIAKRAKAGNKNGTYDRNSAQGKYPLSGRLVCGLCGQPYYRTVRRGYKNHEKIFEWKCSRYLENGRTERADLKQEDGCNNIHLKEDALLELIEQIFADIYRPDKEKIIQEMIVLLQRVIRKPDYTAEIRKEQQRKEKIQNQMKLLVDKLLSGVLTDSVYQAKQRELETALENTEKILMKLEAKKSSGAVSEERIENIGNALRNGTLFEQSSAAGMMDKVRKIIIYPACMEIEFEEEHMKIEYGSQFNYLEQKREKRERIVELMKENPTITAKQIAQLCQVSLSQVNYDIRALKREGRIRFNGTGGRGKWEIASAPL